MPASTMSRPLLLTAGFAILFCLTVAALLWLRNTTGLVRIAPMEGLSARSAHNAEVTVLSDRDKFAIALADISGGDERIVLKTVEWVMNRIPTVGNHYRKSSWDMLEARDGQLCSGMAQILVDALLSKGIPARRVFLQFALFDNLKTHVTVEVWVHGRWRVYDPTFHIALRAGKERVGVFEAREWFLKRRGSPVELEFLGDVAYPARIEKYQLPFEAHLNHIFVDLRQPTFPRQLFAYPTDQGLDTNTEDLYRFVYYGCLIGLPLLNVLLFMLSVFSWRRRFAERRAAKGWSTTT